MPKFRPNVAAILQREDGTIFVGERLRIADAWQFPQGGVDDGEGLMTAVRRELHEETGLSSGKYDLVECRSGYTYLFPEKHRKRGDWDGQTQTYFLCRFHGNDDDIDLESTVAEFRRFRWIEPSGFQLSWLPNFKRKVYERVFWDFFGVKLKHG